MHLPPDVSQERFNEATSRFARVLGPEWVFTSDEDIDLYRDAYSPFKGEEDLEYIPSGAIAPKSVEEVQEIVRIANEFLIPLWPISTGRNLAYGGAAPRLTGTMVLDLKRMNRVLEVNEKLAYALVEPGVSYFDFYRYLRANNLKVWLDCPDPGWGSLIGNALDHGVGHTPFRDHFGSHCGMEVVLPNGELIRTGPGAIPNSPSWNTFKYGFGPHISPMFGQSNFGIVTKMGFWLLPEQQAARDCVVQVPLYENVTPFLEIMTHLVCSSIIDGSWQIERSIRQSQDPDIRAALEKGVSNEELGQIGAKKGIAYWWTRLHFYGPPGVIDAKYAYVREKFAAIPGTTITLGGDYRFPLDPDTVDNSEDLFAKASLGIPELAIFSLTAQARAAQSLRGQAGFSPVIPATGPELMRAHRVFTEAFRELGLGAPTLDVVWSWFDRSLVMLMGMITGDDPQANKIKRENFKRLIAIAGENGWGAYRTAPLFMDEVMAVHSFNNHALRRFHETVKDALDPNGILAPGKSGIWPKRLRKS